MKFLIIILIALNLYGSAFVTEVEQEGPKKIKLSEMTSLTDEYTIMYHPDYGVVRIQFELTGKVQAAEHIIRRDSRLPAKLQTIPKDYLHSGALRPFNSKLSEATGGSFYKFILTPVAPISEYGDKALVMSNMAPMFDFQIKIWNKILKQTRGKVTVEFETDKACMMPNSYIMKEYINPRMSKSEQEIHNMNRSFCEKRRKINAPQNMLIRTSDKCYRFNFGPYEDYFEGTDVSDYEISCPTSKYI